MINLLIILVIASLAGFGNFTTSSLVVGVIVIRCSISLILYWKFNSILALLWIIVYLGGMMVCFVYILFIAHSEDPQFYKSHVNSWKGLQGLNIILIFRMILTLKGISTRRGENFDWISPMVDIKLIVHTESYCQIVSQTSSFFLLLVFIVLYNLLQVIRILRFKSKRGTSSLL